MGWRWHLSNSRWLICACMHACKHLGPLLSWRHEQIRRVGSGIRRIRHPSFAPLFISFHWLVDTKGSNVPSSSSSPSLPQVDQKTFRYSNQPSTLSDRSHVNGECTLQPSIDARWTKPATTWWNTTFVKDSEYCWDWTPKYSPCGAKKSTSFERETKSSSCALLLVDE